MKMLLRISRFVGKLWDVLHSWCVRVKSCRYFSGLFIPPIRTKGRVRRTHAVFAFLVHRPSTQSCRSWWRSTPSRRGLSRPCTRRCSETRLISTLYRDAGPHGCVWPHPHSQHNISRGWNGGFVGQEPRLRLERSWTSPEVYVLGPSRTIHVIRHESFFWRTRFCW